MGKSVLFNEEQIMQKKTGKTKAQRDAAELAEMQRTTSGAIRKGIRQGGAVYDDNFSQKRINAEKAKRSSDIVSIIDQRREAAKGLSSEENAARMDSAQKASAADTIGALRQTRGMLSGAGVRGGTAGGALGNVAAQGAAKMADQRRQFLLDDVTIRKAGLDAFEQSVVGQEGIERDALTMRGKAQYGFADLAQQGATLPYVLRSNDRAGAAAAKAAGSGPSVICTELHRQGIMSDAVYAADTFYGMMCIDEQTLRGYQTLARPVARLMARSTIVTAIIAPIAMAWANNMAAEMGLDTPRSALVGKLGAIGERICHMVGHFVPRKKELARVRI